MRVCTGDNFGPMAAAKTERLLNLTICLLSTTRFVLKDEIRQLLAPYQEISDEAFDRMFERDKEELRKLGVPIQTGSNDAFFSDEVGYRIPPGDFELPPVEFTAEEATVLGVAARGWREASLASTTVNAMAKLRAAGVEVNSARLPALEPVMTAREPGFGVCYDAVIDQTLLRFDYADRGVRTLEPWGMTSQRGRWYVVGRDVDKDAVRVFRVSRINGLPTRIGPPGAFTVPPGTDIAALARSYGPEPERFRAIVALRPNRAAALRRRSEQIDPTGLAGRGDELSAEAAGLPVPAGFEWYEVAYGSRIGLVEELASYAADVVVLAPADLREALKQHLAVWAGGPSDARRIEPVEAEGER